MYKSSIFATVMLLLCNLFYIANINAGYQICGTGCFKADTCSSSDVQSAINAASNGERVLVPSGTCDWTAQVILSAKGIDLRGDGIDQTIINDNYASSKAVLQLNVPSGSSVRVSGFTFDATNSTAPATSGTIKIYGGTTKFRIDNVKVKKITGTGIVIGQKSGPNPTYGVIDNCILESSATTGLIAISVIGIGDTDWTTPLSFGTADAVYVEDCTINLDPTAQPQALDAYNGARFVFRYNTVVDANLGYHGYDSGGFRSVLQAEVYQNTFTANGIFARGFHSRGGTGVLYNNSWTSNFISPMVLNYFRSCPKSFTGYDCAERCNNDGSGCSDTVDGNEDATGYPCRDQPGIGSNQAKVPFYEWGNTHNGSDADFSIPDKCDNPDEQEHIQVNRDYFTDETQKPAYTAHPYPHPLTVELTPPQNLEEK